MAKKYTASLRDIAELSGVSISTVSRVIHRKSTISPKTTQAVMKAANKLGYHSNMLIEGMKTGKTGTIGVIVPIDDNFFRQIVSKINNELTSKSYLPINVWPDSEGTNELVLIKRLIEQRVEGIIMRPTKDWAGNDYFSDVIKRGLPLVLIDRKIPAELDFVASDDYEGGVSAAKYLYELGHRKIACYQGPQLASPAALRRKGLEDFLSTKADAEMFLCGNGGWEDFSVDIVYDFLQKHPDVTAFSAFSDIYAIDIYDATAKLGRRIPDDISVVGFGNLPESNYARPRLTTMNQFPEQLAKAAIERLFFKIEHGLNSPGKDIRIKPELLIKESCKKLKA